MLLLFIRFFNLNVTYFLLLVQNWIIAGLWHIRLIYKCCQVNKRCRFLIEFEKEVKRLLEDIAAKDHPFEGKDVDASSLGWAMSAVSSRAFRLHGAILSDGKHSEVPMMLPLIDMCNHSFHPNARIVQEQDTSSSKMLVKVSSFVFSAWEQSLDLCPVAAC